MNPDNETDTIALRQRIEELAEMNQRLARRVGDQARNFQNSLNAHLSRAWSEGYGAGIYDGTGFQFGGKAPGNPYRVDA